MKRAKITHLNSTRKLNELTNFSYADLFEHIIDGVLVVNSLGLVEYINPAYEDMFGVSNFAMRGKSIYGVPNDDIVLTSLKGQKNVKGYINEPVSAKRYSATASIITEGNSFNGVMAIYREETDYQKIYKKSIVKKSSQPKVLKAFEGIIGSSKGIIDALMVAEKAARSNATVLITGETGTGKGVIAEGIHNASGQCDKPLVKVNCGAIPYNLLESELFGHEQGAFTGAIKRKIGKFEQANGGTIFLDEIGDMPMDMQVKVLRVIQEKEFERVGGNESIKCDVRIIAATHRDLKELIARGEFREDLYYRLNVIPIYVPALKERQGDIIDLSYHYMNKISQAVGADTKVLNKDVEKAFASYHWPGNIRELKNLMERLMVLVEDMEITLEDLPSEISKTYEVNRFTTQGQTLINQSVDGKLATMDEYEKEIIKEALKLHGSFNKAAKALGITHKTVAAKARKYNIVE